MKLNDIFKMSFLCVVICWCIFALCSPLYNTPIYQHEERVIVTDGTSFYAAKRGMVTRYLRYTDSYDVRLDSGKTAILHETQLGEEDGR